VFNSNSPDAVVSSTNSIQTVFLAYPVISVLVIIVLGLVFVIIASIFLEGNKSQVKPVSRSSQFRPTKKPEYQTGGELPLLASRSESVVDRSKKVDQETESDSAIDEEEEVEEDDEDKDVNEEDEDSEDDEEPEEDNDTERENDEEEEDWRDSEADDLVQDHLFVLAHFFNDHLDVFAPRSDSSPGEPLHDLLRDILICCNNEWYVDPEVLDQLKGLPIEEVLRELNAEACRIDERESNGPDGCDDLVVIAEHFNIDLFGPEDEKEDWREAVVEDLAWDRLLSIARLLHSLDRSNETEACSSIESTLNETLRVILVSCVVKWEVSDNILKEFEGLLIVEVLRQLYDKARRLDCCEVDEEPGYVDGLIKIAEHLGIQLDDLNQQDYS